MLLLLITNAYIPETIKELIIGLKIFSFNLSFMNIREAYLLNYFVKWLDSPQQNDRISETGLSSQSALVNNIDLFMTFCLIVIFHCVFRLCMKLIFKYLNPVKYAKCRRIFERLIRPLELSVYIRMFLEALQVITTSVLAELSELEASTGAQICSLAFTIILALLIAVSLAVVTIITLKYKQSDQEESQQYKWYDELFEGVKLAKYSKGFTLY